MSQDMIALINTLRTSTSWAKRRDAAEALSSFKDSTAVDALIEVLDNDDNWVPRFKAADALGDIGDERAIPHLSQGLHQNEQAVQKSCAKALAKFGSQAIDILSSAIHSEDTVLRSFVIEAMGNVKNPQFKPLLIEALNDPSNWVMRNAVYALGDLGDPSVSDRLLGLLENNTNLESVAAVRNALNKLGIKAAKRIAKAERKAEETFLANLKELKVGMSESEVKKLVGGGVFQGGNNTVYRNRFGEFQLVFAGGRLVEIPEGYGPSRMIEQMEDKLSRKKWWQFWK